jgi:hypothetical protein
MQGIPLYLEDPKIGGLMTRKLSVSESQRMAQFLGASSSRNFRTGTAEVIVGGVAAVVGHVLVH